MAAACRVVPPCFSGTEFSLCVCVLSPLSSASLPHKAVTQGQVFDREKQVDWGSGWAHRDLFPPVKDVTSRHRHSFVKDISRGFVAAHQN